MNPYQDFVAGIARTLHQAKNAQLGGFPAAAKPQLAADAPRVLIFSPHPDDEVIIGGLALRFLREAKANVINVAVTQGSNKARQAERWKELTACCEYIGFGLVQTREGGLEGINPKSRAAQPTEWAGSVTRIAEIIREHHPKAVFLPHDRDWNSTHVGTHHLVADALRELGPAFECLTLETEFWGAMDDPNLMVETSETDLADLLTALSFHVGELKRNPYHLRMPAWMIDNVRRGSELVGGQGGAAPDFVFSTLYRLRRWRNGGFEQVLDRGQFVGSESRVTELLCDSRRQ
jgi:LmbE family N-acetylglucosaminyl deacetylase